MLRASASILRISSVRIAVSPNANSFQCAKPATRAGKNGYHLACTSPRLMSSTPSQSATEINFENMKAINTPEVSLENVTDLTTMIEPSFYSQGLGFANWMPPGWLQGMMEQMHLALDLPWWATIVATTVVLRVGVFPLVIKSRKAFVRQGNLNPQLMEYQNRMMDMSLSQKESMKAKDDYFKFMTDNGIHPKMTLLPVFCNGAIFMSMFFAIRGMAYLPVKSLETGGIFWFTDLTVADPFFVLPLITATSLMIHIRIGGDGMNLDTLNPLMRKFILFMPIMTIPVMCSFPAALNLYWLTSNIVTITQSRILALEPVRSKFGIPKIVKHSTPAAYQSPFSNMVESLKNANQSQGPAESFEEIQKRIEESMKKAIEKKERRL